MILYQAFLGASLSFTQYNALKKSVLNKEHYTFLWEVLFNVILMFCTLSVNGHIQMNISRTFDS